MPRKKSKSKTTTKKDGKEESTESNVSESDPTMAITKMPTIQQLSEDIDGTGEIVEITTPDRVSIERTDTTTQTETDQVLVTEDMILKRTDSDNVMQLTIDKNEEAIRQRDELLEKQQQQLKDVMNFQKNMHNEHEQILLQLKEQVFIVTEKYEQMQSETKARHEKELTMHRRHSPYNTPTRQSYDRSPVRERYQTDRSPG